MEEADSMLGFHISLAAREEYNKKLEAVFKEFKDAKGWDMSRLHDQDPQVTDPVEAWQRELPADRIKTLKADLVKRMVSLLGQATPLSQELQTRFIMFQKGLISEAQWRHCTEAKQQVDEEVLLIKFEAECLQDNFGNEGQVFKLANNFYHHELQKKRAEMNRRVPPPEILQELAKMQKGGPVTPEMLQELARKSGGRIKIQTAPSGGEQPPTQANTEGEETTPSTEDPAEKLRRRRVAEAMMAGLSEPEPISNAPQSDKRQAA